MVRLLDGSVLPARAERAAKHAADVEARATALSGRGVGGRGRISLLANGVAIRELRAGRRST
jgi:hypothetical protein